VFTNWFFECLRIESCLVYMLQVALMVILIIMCGVCVVVMSKCDMCSQTGFF